MLGFSHLSCMGADASCPQKAPSQTGTAPLTPFISLRTEAYPPARLPGRGRAPQSHAGWSLDLQGGGELLKAMQAGAWKGLPDRPQHGQASLRSSAPLPAALPTAEGTLTPQTSFPLQWLSAGQQPASPGDFLFSEILEIYFLRWALLASASHSLPHPSAKVPKIKRWMANSQPSPLPWTSSCQSQQEILRVAGRGGQRSTGGARTL